MALLLLTSCTTPVPAPQLRGPVMGGMSGPALKASPPPEVQVRLQMPDRSVPLDWLELDGFFPPGAKRVGPKRDEAFSLTADNRMSFPTAELYPSPNQEFTLFHDGAKRGRKEITHWLMLYKKGATFPNAIFNTSASFDASWAPDSSGFAITHYVGSNSSEVFVCTASLVKETIDIKPIVREFFPPHFLDARVFVKAYRWSSDGALVIRAVGRSWIEPFELFGLEAAVRLGGGEGETTARFLRGYIRE
jgi:hypothetical protein